MPAAVLWWILAACVFVVAPVAFRLLVGDDPPANEITHESADGRERDPEPPLLAAAA